MKASRKVARKVAIFTDKYPLIGPLVWILSAQYFVFQFIAAAAWDSGYSWKLNVISDLGNTACGQYAGRYVCSPDYMIMNGSFLMLGFTMALGSLLIYQEFRQSRASFIGFSLMALAGSLSANHMVDTFRYLYDPFPLTQNLTYKTSLKNATL